MPMPTPRHLSLPACLIALLAVIAPMHAAAQQPAARDADAVETLPEPVRNSTLYPLPAGQAIAVDNPYGSVYMRFGGYEHTLEVWSTLQQPEGAPAMTLAPTARDGRFVVAPVLPDGATLAAGQRIDLVLYVPEGHPVTLRAGGDIEARGVRSDLELRNTSGKIQVRAMPGYIVQAESSEGRVEVAMEGPARPGTVQRIASRTGSVTVLLGDDANAEVRMATSQQFATDFSLQVEHLDGREPNKAARAVIGTPRPGKDKAEIVVESLVNEVRLLRRAVFVDPE